MIVSAIPQHDLSSLLHLEKFYVIIYVNNDWCLPFRQATLLWDNS